MTESQQVSRFFIVVFVLLLFINIYELTRLGVDEFNRSYLLTFYIGSLFSVLRGFVMTAALFILCGFLVFFMEIKRNNLLRSVVSVIMDALESINAYLWVLLAASIYGNNIFVIAIIFMIVGLPLVLSIFTGSVRTVFRKEYCKAAIALGVSDLRLFFRHIIPNIREPLLAMWLSVYGAAMATYGATAIFGSVNREELDLGVFLLRGKELAPEDTGLLVATISAYGIIYAGLLYLQKLYAHPQLLNKN